MRSSVYRCRAVCVCVHGQVLIGGHHRQMATGDASQLLDRQIRYTFDIYDIILNWNFGSCWYFVLLFFCWCSRCILYYTSVRRVFVCSLFFSFFSLKYIKIDGQCVFMSSLSLSIIWMGIFKSAYGRPLILLFL